MKNQEITKLNILNQHKNDLKQKQIELKKWQTMKDPEPEREEKVILNDNFNPHAMHGRIG